MTGNQKEFQSAMNQGHSAAWDQMWEQAAEHYQRALSEFPENSQALTSMGLAFFEQQKFDEALKYYQKAAVVNPNDPIPVEKIARIFERTGKLQEAIKVFVSAADLYLKNKDVEKSIESWVRIITLEPEHIMARTRLAMIYERMGQKPKAINEYLATASLMQHSGNVSKAKQIVEYCLKLDPENTHAQQAYARLRGNQLLAKPIRPRGGTGPVRMAEVKKLEKPENLENKSMDPVLESNQKALVKLAAILFDRAEGDEPFEKPVTRRGISAITRGTGTLNPEKVDNTRISLYLGQAIDSQTKGDKLQAVKELESALNAGLNHPAAFYNLGYLLADKDPRKAARYLQKALKNYEFSLGAYLLLSKILFEEENYSEAVNAILHALSLADAATVPSDISEEIRQLYEPIIESQSQKKGEDDLKKIYANISNQINRPDWRQYLITARQQMPEQTEDSPAIPVAEMILETGSSTVVEALAHVRKLTKEGKYYSAIEEAYYALQYAPTYLPLHIQIGELLLEQGKTENAVNKFLIVANLYSLRGETSQGIRMLERIIRLAPLNVKILRRLIELHLDHGDTIQALENYLKLAEAHYQLAELDNAHEVYSEALSLALQTKTHRSWRVKILYKQADIDMQRLDLRKATRIFEQIRTLEPEDANARTRLVSLNFRLGQDNAAINELDSFVSLLENSGKRQSAVQFLNQMIEQLPDKLELRKRLADLYVRSGKNMEAVAQLDKIADLLMNAGNQHGAITMIKAIIALNPPNVEEYKRALQQMRE